MRGGFTLAQKQRGYLGPDWSVSMAACRTLWSLGLAAATLAWLGAFQRNDGSTVVEYSVPCPAALGRLTDGPDRSEWFVSDATCAKHVDEGSIGRIDVLTGSVTQWVAGYAHGARPGGLVSNGGYLWVADQHEYAGGGFILEITTGGQQLAAIAIGHVPAEELAVGLDGNVWFIGAKGNGRKKPVVGYVTPQRAVSVFHFNPASGVDPSSLSAGPDGNMWVADRHNGVLYRVDAASGALTPVGVGGNPAFLTHDANALEFSDAEVAQISTLTLKGRLHTYRAPAGEFPGRLTRKPGGTIAYVDERTGGIGDFNPATGHYGPEVVPPGGGVGYLASGADGNLWFDDTNGTVGALLEHVLTTEPTSLQFSASVSGCAPASLNVAETNYAGGFTAWSANTKIASVAQIGSATFSVSPAGPGSTTINVVDGQQNDVNVTVLVDASCVGGR